MTGKILFLDFETTGLDPEHDRVLEVGAMLVDDNLERIDAFRRVLAYPGEACCPACFILARGRVREDGGGPVLMMHQQSGLLDELFKGWATGDCPADAEMALLEWLESFELARGELELAGYSIHFDRSFIRAQMPSLDRFLSHRMIDVSSLRSLHRRWIGQLPDQVKAHRALADCEAAIEELRGYRRELFGPARRSHPPGGCVVYVCCASAEIERAERMIARASEIPGVTVALDWPAHMRAEGRPDSEVPVATLRRVFRDELRWAGAVDTLVFLHPEQSTTVVGWAELGAAFLGRSDRRPRVVVARHAESPPGVAEPCHPFAEAVADVVLTTDAAVLAWLAEDVSP